MTNCLVSPQLSPATPSHCISESTAHVVSFVTGTEIDHSKALDSCSVQVTSRFRRRASRARNCTGRLRPRNGEARYSMFTELRVILCGSVHAGTSEQHFPRVVLPHLCGRYCQSQPCAVPGPSGVYSTKQQNRPSPPAFMLAVMVCPGYFRPWRGRADGCGHSHLPDWALHAPVQPLPLRCLG